MFFVARLSNPAICLGKLDRRGYWYVVRLASPIVETSFQKNLFEKRLLMNPYFVWPWSFNDETQAVVHCSTVTRNLEAMRI